MATNDKLIQVTDLKKHYNKGAIKALDDVSIDIHKGDVMVVIGPSGSGKSTFLRSLNLMEEPTDGEIIFHGIDITKKSFINKQGKKEKVFSLTLGMNMLLLPSRLRYRIMKKTLIVIDMQNDFIDMALGTAEAVAIVPKVKEKISEYISRGDEIIFTRDTHQENYLETMEGKKELYILVLLMSLFS